MRTNALTQAVIFASGLVFATSGIFAGPEPIDTGKDSKTVELQPAPVCAPRWYVSLGGGAEWDIGANDFTREVRYSAFGFFPGIGPFSVTQRTPSLDWHDV